MIITNTLEKALNNGLPKVSCAKVDELPFRFRDEPNVDDSRILVFFDTLGSIFRPPFTPNHVHGFMGIS